MKRVTLVFVLMLFAVAAVVGYSPAAFAAPDNGTSAAALTAAPSGLFAQI